MSQKITISNAICTIKIYYIYNEIYHKDIREKREKKKPVKNKKQ